MYFPSSTADDGSGREVGTYQVQALIGGRGSREWLDPTTDDVEENDVQTMPDPQLWTRDARQ